MRGNLPRALVAAACLLLACRTGHELVTDAGPDGPRLDAAADAPPPPDDGGTACTCPADTPVEMFHACTPPLRVGCPATLCTPGVTDCGEGHTCEDCSAAACCICAACVPSCVQTGLAQGPLPDYLKLRSSLGPAGEEQDVVIEGFPFYIGALYYLARVGDSGDLWESVAVTSPCALGFRAPARGPGMVPVWLSQYGGGEPWVLAGFYTYSAGDYPTCVQPGYPCGATDTCCETTEVPMACIGGRCRHE